MRKLLSASSSKNPYFKAKRSRKSHKKSRLGCLQCKKKRKKCDEQLPVCKNCQQSANSVCSYLLLNEEEKQKIVLAHEKLKILEKPNAGPLGCDGQSPQESVAYYNQYYQTNNAPYLSQVSQPYPHFQYPFKDLSNMQFPQNSVPAYSFPYPAIQQSSNAVELNTTSSTATSPIPLPNAISQTTTFNLNKYKKGPSVIKQPEPSESRMEIFDRGMGFKRIRVLVLLLVEMSFINARKADSVFSSLVCFAFQLIEAKSNPPDFGVSDFEKPTNDGLRNATLGGLHLTHFKKKQEQFELDKQQLRSVAHFDSLGESSRDKLLSDYILFKVSCINDVLTWDSCCTFYKPLGDFSADFNSRQAYQSLRDDYLKLLEMLPPFESQFPQNLYYSLQRNLSLTSISEAIKSAYVPEHSPSVLLEFYDDIVQFGSIFKSDASLLSQQAIQDIEKIKPHYYSLVELVGSLVREHVLLNENEKLAPLSFQFALTFSRKWWQLLPENASLLSRNKSLSIFELCFYLFYYAGFQLLSGVFNQSGYFFATKSLSVDFLASGWFDSADFDAIFSDNISSYDGIRMSTNKLIHSHLKKHSIYLMRMISYFRIRRSIVLRYIKLDTVAASAKLDVGYFSTKKDSLSKNIAETQIQSFKKTVFGPEHFFHYNNAGGNYSASPFVDAANINESILKFNSSEIEGNGFFTQNFDSFNMHYHSNFESKIEQVLTESRGVTSVENFIHFKQQISDFSLYEFLGSNEINYFDTSSGLLMFDFNPLDPIDENPSLKAYLQPIAFGVISRYLTNKAGNFDSKRGEVLEYDTSSDKDIELSIPTVHQEYPEIKVTRNSFEQLPLNIPRAIFQGQIPTGDNGPQMITVDHSPQRPFGRVPFHSHQRTAINSSNLNRHLPSASNMNDFNMDFLFPKAAAPEAPDTRLMPAGAINMPPMTGVINQDIPANSNRILEVLDYPGSVIQFGGAQNFDMGFSRIEHSDEQSCPKQLPKL